MKGPAIPISLRHPLRGDVAALAALRNDSRLQRQLMMPVRTLSLPEIRAWIRRRTRDSVGMFFVVAARRDGALLGFVQLTQVDRVNQTADLGIALAAAARGRGVAAAALEQLEGKACRVKLRKITLRVLAANRRAIRFYTKVGFRKVGVWRRHHLQGGAFRDVLLMEKFLAVRRPARP